MVPLQSPGQDTRWLLGFAGAWARKILEAPPSWWGLKDPFSGEFATVWRRSRKWRVCYPPMPTRAIITGTMLTIKATPRMSKTMPVRIMRVMGTAPVP